MCFVSSCRGNKKNRAAARRGRSRCSLSLSLSKGEDRSLSLSFSARLGYAHDRGLVPQSTHAHDAAARELLRPGSVRLPRRRLFSRNSRSKEVRADTLPLSLSCSKVFFFFFFVCFLLPLSSYFSKSGVRLLFSLFSFLLLFLFRLEAC